MLDGFVRFPTGSVCSLGVFVELGLLLDGQVAAVARSTYCQLWLVHPAASLPELEESFLVTYWLNYLNMLCQAVTKPLGQSRTLQPIF